MPDQPLGLRESIDLTEDDAETLRYIEGFDLAAEVSAAVEEGTLAPGRAKAGELELKRFLAIAYLEGEDRESIGPGRRLDALWHNFILNTASYTRFCDRVYGEYLHHAPSRVADQPDRPPGPSGAELAGRYFEDYDAEFWAAPFLCFIL